MKEFRSFVKTVMCRMCMRMFRVCFVFRALSADKFSVFKAKYIAA